MSTQLHSRFLDLRRWRRWSRCVSPPGGASKGSYSGCHHRGSRAGRANLSTSANTPAAKTCGGWIGRCWRGTGKAFIRIHEEETNLLCTLAIDASGSMRFGGAAAEGTGSKLEYAQYLATALAEVISRGQDQVGLAVLDERLRESCRRGQPPRMWAWCRR